MAHKNWEKYKLIMFNVDGTIALQGSDQLLPSAEAFFRTMNEMSDPPKIAFITNQGGVGYRLLLELEGRIEKARDYPTQDQVELRLGKLASAAGVPIGRVYAAYSYKLPNIGIWTPTPINQVDKPQWKRSWRKPNAGMIAQAVFDADVKAKESLVVGDRDDGFAARKAKIDFVYAQEFFREPVLI